MVVRIQMMFQQVALRLHPCGSSRSHPRTCVDLGPNIIVVSLSANGPNYVHTSSILNDTTL